VLFQKLRVASRQREAIAQALEMVLVGSAETDRLTGFLQGSFQSGEGFGQVAIHAGARALKVRNNYRDWDASERSRDRQEPG
jgi:hypothetical protein